MKKLLILASLLATACTDSNQQTASSTAAESKPSAVTIVTSANIYTVNEEQASIEAFAFEQDTIVATGSKAELEQRYANATKLDFGNATIIPGIIDAHGHLLGLGQSLIYVDLMGSTSKEDIVSRLRAGAETLLDGQWLLGRGWDQNDWPITELPNAQDLDAAFPNRPVWLERVDGHANWANSAALTFSEQDLNGDWQPDGGEIVRNSEGQPTGVFIDNAVGLIQSKVPPASPAELSDALSKAMAKTASVGITGMHDAGTSIDVWQLLEGLKSKGELGVRVYAMADGANDMLSYLCDKGTTIDPEALLTARSVKLYSDGALGSRGAALIEDYSDAPGNRGLMIESKETLIGHANRAANCGLQVNIHAIGDRGNRVTLDVLESATQAVNNPGRHRIEHSQVVELGDLPRFKQLGLIASVQPTHATSDMYWAEERVGAERIKGAYAWQKFNDLGVPLALGSDFPVERPDPLPGFHAAVTRQDSKNWPEGGWYPNERLTRAQALHGFTLGAAYAAFEEDKLGSIEVGKFADFVVLSQDIMTVAEPEILNTSVKATYMNGNAIYKADE